MRFAQCMSADKTIHHFKLQKGNHENQRHFFYLSTCRRDLLNKNDENMQVASKAPCVDASNGALKDPSQPPPFSMPSNLLILHGEARSHCLTVSCVLYSIF